MAKKDNRLLAIDIGGDTLKMAEFSFGADSAIVLDRFAFRKLDLQSDAPDAPSFAEVYHEMLAEHGFTASQVRLSISAQSSFLRLSKLPPILGSKNSVGRIVEFEARQNVPYSMDEVEWNYQLMRHEWEEVREETQEDGSSLEVRDVHEEFEALFVAVKTENITEFTDVIQDSGKEVLSVNIAPIPLFNAAKAAQVKDDECVLLLNIGCRASSLIIADHNRVFIRSIPIAGYAITAQIAKAFSIGIEEAEALKQRHGFVALGGAYEEADSELANTISKVSRNIMTRLHGEVSRSINVWRSQHGGNAPDRVLLSGGASVMMYMPDFFQEKLRLPVEYLNSFPAINIGKEVDRAELQAVAPMFQELIGMSMRNVTSCPLEIVLLPKAIRRQKELDRRKPYLYASAAVLVVCLCIFASGVSMMLNFNQRRVDRVKVEVEKTERKQKEVNSMISSLNGAKGAFVESVDYLKQRNTWMEMLAELQSIMPDSMWFTELEGVGDQDAAAQESSSDYDMKVPGSAASTGPTFRFPSAIEKENTNSSASTSGTLSIRDEFIRFATVSDLAEVKRLHLRGCTVIFNDRTLQEKEFMDKIENSKFFASAEIRERLKPNELNLTGFEIYITLKNPIKK